MSLLAISPHHERTPAGRGRGLKLRHRLALVLAVASCLTGGISLDGSAGTPAHASSGISTTMGIGACGWSAASAKAFFTGSPYYNFELYFGGSEAACPVSGSFAATVLQQGWRLMPLWVGRQSSCTSGYGNHISTDPATAFSQGKAEEDAAYNVLSGTGWTWNMSQVPVIYDLEGFNTGNSTCVTAANNFIAGWVSEAHVAPAQIAGVYGSTCASNLQAYASISSVPDFIDGAAYNGNKSVWSMPCVSSSSWVNQQRFKQYNGDHNETWNGYTVKVDSDCADGPTYSSGFSINQGCA
jgi:hypothetical protein